MASILIMMIPGIFPTSGHPKNMKAKFMKSGYSKGISSLARAGLREYV